MGSLIALIKVGGVVIDPCGGLLVMGVESDLLDRSNQGSQTLLQRTAAEDEAGRRSAARNNKKSAWSRGWGIQTQGL